MAEGTFMVSFFEFEFEFKPRLKNPEIESILVNTEYKNFFFCKIPYLT